VRGRLSGEAVHSGPGRIAETRDGTGEASSACSLLLRAPAHREHRFRRIVNADSGIVNTDSGAS
jgi:hypothetical protein